MHIRKLDKTDERILHELIGDAKISLRELAKKVQVSFVTVMHRIRHLEKDGVFRGYHADVDYSKLGFDTQVIIEIKISKGKLFELEKKIGVSHNVCAVYDTTGEYDATVIARFTSTRKLDEFLKQLQMMPNVERTHTKLVLNTIKEAPLRP